VVDILLAAAGRLGGTASASLQMEIQPILKYNGFLQNARRPNA
jgi:hypothetical protein